MKDYGIAERNGIIFLDEIDKVAVKGSSSGPDVSREGVQRDILPIVEGSTVSTKYGQNENRSYFIYRSWCFPYWQNHLI